MTYEEWLADVRRQNALRQDSAAAARPAPPPPPPPSTVEVFLRPRGGAPRRHRPDLRGLLKRPLRVQMLKVRHRQRMMPVVLEVPPPQQVSTEGETLS